MQIHLRTEDAPRCWVHVAVRIPGSFSNDRVAGDVQVLVLPEEPGRLGDSTALSEAGSHSGDICSSLPEREGKPVTQGPSPEQTGRNLSKVKKAKAAPPKRPDSL